MLFRKAFEIATDTHIQNLFFKQLNPPTFGYPGSNGSPLFFLVQDSSVSRKVEE